MSSLFPSLAKKIGETMGSSRVYFNKRDRKNNNSSQELPVRTRRKGKIRRDSYTINVNRERNCYSCRRFSHLARNCRNWSIVDQGKRIKYKNNFNHSNKLKEEESLIVLD